MKSSIIDCQTLQDMKKKMKCPSCTSGWCKNHLFVLKPLNNNLFFRKEQKIRVCPKFNKEKDIFDKIVPTIHGDGKHYTPFFVLDDEKKYYTENDQRVKRNHLAKVQEDNSGKSQMKFSSSFICHMFLSQLVPKHARKKNYCAVCRTDYEDYLEHIQSAPHKRMIQNNRFNSYILQIEQMFKKNNQQNKNETTVLTDQSSEGALNAVRKYIKID